MSGTIQPIQEPSTMASSRAAPATPKQAAAAPAAATTTSSSKDQTINMSTANCCLKAVTQPAVWSIIVSVLLIAFGTAMDSWSEPRGPLTALQQLEAERSGVRRFCKTIGWLCVTAGIITILMASVVIPYRILRGKSHDLPE